MYTEIEKRAIKFIDETDMMQFSTMEVMVMFLESEKKQLTLTDVVERSEQLRSLCEWCNGSSLNNCNNDYSINDLG